MEVCACKVWRYLFSHAVDVKLQRHPFGFFPLRLWCCVLRGWRHRGWVERPGVGGSSRDNNKNNSHWAPLLLIGWLKCWGFFLKRIWPRPLSDGQLRSSWKTEKVLIKRCERTQAEFWLRGYLWTQWECRCCSEDCATWWSHTHARNSV